MKKILLITFIFFALQLNLVSAQTQGGNQGSSGSSNSNSPICIPSSCAGEGQYEPDFACINQQLLDPTNNCCENKCKNISSGNDNPDSFTKLIDVFGSSIVIETDDPIGVIAVLVNLAITTVLGFISLYAIVRGIYEGGIKRARSIDSGEIEETTKTVQTLILGFVLAWSFIFIIQFITSILGLGSLSDLTVLQDDLAGDADNQIVIQ